MGNGIDCDRRGYDYAVRRNMMDINEDSKYVDPFLHCNFPKQPDLFFFRLQTDVAAIGPTWLARKYVEMGF